MTIRTITGSSDNEPFDAEAETKRYREAYRGILGRIAGLGTVKQRQTSNAMRGMLRLTR